ncbi:MAG: hypothetical protein J6R36_02765, partial [Bacteroidaceae bacterium]|nr:hypothetical protein [Bacteroidaceae bacterium]
NSNSKQTEKKLIFHKFIILQYTTQSYHFFAESAPLNAHKTYYKQLKNIKIATALVIKHDRGEDTTRLRCFHNTTAVEIQHDRGGEITASQSLIFSTYSWSFL